MRRFHSPVSVLRSEGGVTLRYRACNSGFSGDDDYFLNLALDWDASESGDGRAVVEKRLRSMKRKQGRNVWKPFFAKVKAVEVYSPGGLYLTNSFEFKLDTGRLIRTVNRMIRGLYFEFTKTPLPPGDCTRSMLFSHYVEQHNGEPDAVEFIQFIPQLPGRVVGTGTFEVRYSLLDPARYSSFWYLEFFRRFAFVGTTVMDNENGGTRQHSDPNGTEGTTSP